MAKKRKLQMTLTSVKGGRQRASNAIETLEPDEVSSQYLHEVFMRETSLPTKP